MASALPELVLAVLARVAVLVGVHPAAGGGGGGVGPLGALSLTLAAQSNARFDLEQGALQDRDWLVLSRTTRAGGVDPADMRHPYAMAGTLRRILPGETVHLSPTGPWGASPPGQTCVALDQARAGLEAALDAPLAAPQ